MFAVSVGVLTNRILRIRKEIIMAMNLFSRWIKKSLGLRKRGDKRQTFRQTLKPGLEVLEDRALPSAYVVTTTADGGAGSLRDAINQVNADTSHALYASPSNPSVDEIDFAIPGSGTRTIQPLTSLPTITNSVIIDGTSQPGYSGTLLIELNGVHAGGGVFGLYITAGHCTVRGLAIDQFGNTAIQLTGGGGNWIAGNDIGTDANGDAGLGNNGHGVNIAGSSGNTIGGTAPGDGNVISGNSIDGIAINGTGATGNFVQGNLIGTSVNGTAALGNNRAGVTISVGATNNTIGGATAAARNIVSGNNVFGIWITNSGTSNNVIEGDYVGTDVTGEAAIPNGEVGIRIDAGASGNLVGTDGNGSPDQLQAERNLISGNHHSFEPGIVIGGGTSNNVVAGNYIGTDVTGTQSLLNGIGIDLGGDSNFVGTTAAGVAEAATRNVISGNGDGIQMGGTHNVVAGNFIGTDPTGCHANLNVGYGIFMGGQYNRIGTNGDGVNDAAEGNVIDSGFTDIYCEGDFGAAFNAIAGNLIGTDVTGTVVLTANTYGIKLSHGAHDNRIGANASDIDPAAERNVISGHNLAIDSDGGHANLIAGNLIGSDITGLLPLGNYNGIGINDNNDQILDNLISAATIGELGIGGTGNVVAGNLIGTDITGTASLGGGAGGGGAGGISIGGSNNTIGGTSAGAGNIISGNAGAGVGIFGVATTGNLIEGNYIGTDVTGTNALGNGGGVLIGDGVSNNTIGGTTAGAGNTIAYNHSDGVSVPSVYSGGISILGNSIHENGGLGIHLHPGINNNRPAPVLTAAFSGVGLTVLTGTITSVASATVRVEFFANAAGDPEGRTLLGSQSVTTDAAGHGSFTAVLPAALPAGEGLVTSTVTDPSGSTSQFSAGLVATPFPPPTLTLSGPASVDQGVSYDLTLGPVVDPNPNDCVLQYTVHWGDGTSDTYGSNTQTAQHVYSAAGTDTVSVDITESWGSWSTLAAAAMPWPATVHTAAALDGKIYVYSGWQGNGTPQNQFAVFDPASNTWTALPTPSADMAVIGAPLEAAGGNLYLFGGTGSLSGNVTNAIQEYIVSQAQWVTLPATLPDQVQGWRAATAANGDIYVFGGVIPNGPLVNAGVVFDPATGTVQLLPAMPMAAAGMVAAGSDGSIYVIGGGEFGTYLDAVQRFTPDANDPASGTWALLSNQPLPNPRYGASAVLGADGRIYIFGGNDGSPMSDVEAYTPGGGWTAVAPLPIGAINSAAAVGPDGRMYVFGGSSAGQDAINTGQVFTPPVTNAPDSPFLDVASTTVTVDDVAPTVSVLPMTQTGVTFARSANAFGNGADYTFAAQATDAQGRTYVPGLNQDGRVTVTRYNPDGSIDTSFGTGGTATSAADPTNPDVQYQDSSPAVALDSQGRILVTASYFDDNNYNDVSVLARFAPDGTPDPTFGDLTAAPSAVGAGTVVTVAGTFSDPGGANDAPYSYSWNVSANNGDVIPGAAGTVPTYTGAVPNFSFTTAAGRSYTITLTVSDKHAMAGASTSVTINVAEAPSLVVTTTADESDPYDGQTSLREALAYANSAASGSDPTITFAPGLSGTITLTGGQLEVSRTGDPTTNAVTIDATGHAITIDGNNTTGVFSIGAGVSGVLDGLTIADGNTGSGGGINNAGTLTLSNCALTANSAYTGGGISNTGDLAISGCTFTNNTAGYYGAGIANEPSGTLTVTQCTFSGNTAIDGAAINSEGVMTVRASSFTGSSVRDFGGAFSGGGTATFDQCTIADNSAGWAGGAINVGDGTLVLSNCTITDNTSGDLAGGVQIDGCTATISQCTFSGNTAANFGGAISNGDFDSSGPLTVEGSTLSGNGAGGGGGGIHNAGGATLVLANTIIANSPSGLDLYNDGGSASVQSSLIQSQFGTDLQSGVNGNLVGVDPLLAALGDYGGPTQTFALLPGSPSLGAGSAALAVDAQGNALTTDQRGLARVVGGSVDIGAFESRGFTLSGAGGSGQSTSINTAFANPLTVTVSSAYGEPVDGGQVTFTAPGLGASASLTGTPATIGANGQASVAPTANSVVGQNFTVTASAAGANSVAFTLSNTYPPTVHLTQPAAVGNTVSLTLTASDPFPAFQAAGFTYTLDWGDGTTPQVIGATAGNGSGVAVNHTNTSDGFYLVSVTATNAAGAASHAASGLICVNTHIAASISIDGAANATDLILVSGSGGFDTFTVHESSSLTTPITIVGSGSDTLNVYGSSDPTVSNYLVKDGAAQTVTWGTSAGQVAESVGYSNIQALNIYGGAGTNYITDPGTQTNIFGGPGQNTIVITATSGTGVVINGGPGTNNYVIDLGSLAGPVTIHNSNASATDSLSVVGAPGDNAITASGNQVTAGAQTITDTASLANLTVTGGSGNNQLTVSSLTVPVQNVTLAGGGGTNTYTVSAGTVKVVAGTGVNVLNVTGGTVAGITAPAGDTRPLVFAHSYSVLDNGTLSVPASGVLASDISANGQLLTAVLASGPAHGTVSLRADGSFTYTPAANFVGTDSFTYQAKGSDGTLSTAAPVTIQVSYHFGGFLAPLNANIALALNRTVPIKFRLTDAPGNSVTSLSAVVSLKIFDAHGMDILAGAGKTGLGVSGPQFMYNWQTKGLIAGKYTITLALADGTLDTLVVQLSANGSSAALLVDGAGSAAPVTGVLLGGNIELYVDNSNGELSAAELARIQDAVNAVDAVTETYGVTIEEVNDPTLADATLKMDSTSAVGGLADGVLGCTTDAGEITIVQGWNFYTGASATTVPAGQYDFQSVATHELGHALGLGHSSDANSTMFATLDTGMARRNLMTADLAIPDTDNGACGLHVQGWVDPSQPLTGLAEASLPTRPARATVLVELPGITGAPAALAWNQDGGIAQGALAGGTEDVLVGGAGHDLVVGQEGRDVLIGGFRDQAQAPATEAAFAGNMDSLSGQFHGDGATLSGL
jgi:titin